MSTARGNVARQSHDGGETSHETPVIPLRPGLAEPSRKPPPEPLDVARRQAEALRLSRDEELSLRDIGERLGVSKDTVSRDIKAAIRDEAQAAEETSRAASQVSQETDGGVAETPAAPDDGDRDTIVLVLDEPMRQALAVLRAQARTPDTPAHNTAAARAAIRAVADTILEGRRHTEGGICP
jgi:predicted DNA-binding protein (UPF0251 family)